MIARRMAGLLVCALCLAVLGAPVWAEDAPAATTEKETVDTDAYGTVTQFFRARVAEDDLGMPVWQDGQLLNSGVYRLRDRKNRDLLRYAFARFSTTQHAETIVAFYLKALGKDARRETDKGTGAVTVFTGDAQNSRVVTITPQDENCRLLLEHVEHFTVAPRVYTEREQQVARVVEEMSRAYQQTQHLAYTLEQQVVTVPPADKPAPVLVWKVDFRRPRQLILNVSAEGVVGLDIATRKDKLVITRPGQEPTERNTGAALTVETVPELQSDPVARLFLGDALLTDDIDYLGVQPVGDAPLAQQIEVVLTFPEDQTVLRLQIDRQRRVISRAETVVRQDDRETHVIRTYTYNAAPEPAQTAPAAPPPTATP